MIGSINCLVFLNVNIFTQIYGLKNLLKCIEQDCRGRLKIFEIFTHMHREEQ